MPDIRRILDANANRAREAMRVLEDAARFAWNDADLSEKLKHLRHDFAAALTALDADVELHRDTPHDVGTALTTDAESSRPDTDAVVIAAGKRLSEALRALEEFGKTLDPAFAKTIESLRYRGYAIESAIHHRLAATRHRHQWRVCVLITESLCAHHDWLDVAAAAIDGGADCLQLREKHLDAGPLLHRAHQLKKLISKKSSAAAPVSLIINDRPDVALAADADGVHLGQSDLPLPDARRLVGTDLTIGLSTTDLTQAHAAIAAGANYCGVGPMFETTTKHKPHLAGPDYLRQFIDQFPDTPHLAIGGITPDNITELVKVGCQGVAVSAVICAAPDPASIVAALRQALPANTNNPSET